MEYMFAPGFLGTKAPFFMDIVTLVVALLPFAIYLGILFARRGHYGLHRGYQWVLFLLSFLVVVWFEYGVRVGGGFSGYAAKSPLPTWILLAVLVLHILIAVLTLLWWLRTLMRADRHWRKRNLPGGYSLRHIRNGWRTAWGIFLTSLSGIWVYLLLFVF
jgi:putative membrane protein